MENDKYPEQLVFGLDIGTRSIVGTVGYKEKNQFIVVAQCIKEHETRAMMDGQIHDIDKVTESIKEVKAELEKQIEMKLTEVCIAAAGRVLKTIKVMTEYVFSSETTVNEEHVHALDLMGVEKAYETLREELKGDKINFYCVGYSVVNYMVNGYSMFKLNGHKANRIGTELLATFLPDEVINGLYAAVEAAGLKVASLTLEPIAAINVAIPEKFRLLNIAMVDVGAGTSDICITKDGTIIAYGMIPYAGDEITDYIGQKYLVEFKVAEAIKVACLRKKKVSFKDVMGATHRMTTDEILTDISEIIQKITQSIADRIIELNGGKTVSAVFIVGGGGKIPGFIELLADYLKLPKERVALRGEEVLGSVTFLQEHIKKDSLLVTPIGICLNYYDQSNNFIFVTINGEHIKLYFTNKLSISDAAVQMGYPNEKLFPRRGKSITFTVNGVQRTIKGETGEAAHIRLNGEIVGISHNISQNDKIEITESTVGNNAKYELNKLPEYNSNLNIIVNGSKILFPVLIQVNGKQVSSHYMIQDNDEIELLSCYTLKQVMEYMDLTFDGEILVNNEYADLDTMIYDKFMIQFKLNTPKLIFEPEKSEVIPELESPKPELVSLKPQYESPKPQYESSKSQYESSKPQYESPKPEPKDQKPNWFELAPETKVKAESSPSATMDIYVTVNSTVVKLSNKNSYIFVDVFDFYPFDLSSMKGSELVVLQNGERAEFTSALKDKDMIEIYWKK